MSREIPHIVMKNGEFLRVEDLDTVCEQLRCIFDDQEADCGGDIKIYRKLIKEYNAECSFQEP